MVSNGLDVKCPIKRKEKVLRSIVPVVLSGGAGSRLWPVSRQSHPKPFMTLADGQTLLEKTYARIAMLKERFNGSNLLSVLTVTNRDYFFMSKDELAKTGLEGIFLLEPVGRNTAGAITVAAAAALSIDPEAILLVLPADHLVQNGLAFFETVNQAIQLAEDGHLVTFGIVPDRPETGFGYIKKGASLGTGFIAEDFVEKPNLETATHYLECGNFLWNSGMFCFEARTLLEQMKKFSPDVASSALLAWQNVHKSGYAGVELAEPDFIKIPDISVDFALMERSDKVAVIEADFGWSDVGSWQAIKELVGPDSQGNRALGDAVFVNSTDTFVQSEGRLVAAVGVNDVMIIETSDAILVAESSHAQDVKKVVELLKKMGHQSVKSHATVIRPWGSYSVLEVGLGYKIKRIEVRPEASLSLQSHHHRCEHWIVVNGIAKVFNGDTEFCLQANQSTYIPAGHKHRLSNAGEEPLVLIEVQTGKYLGEDDIVRFEDKYGRTL